MTKVFFIAFLPFFLAACGFQPMYGTSVKDKNSTLPQTKMAQIEIANIPNREGQMLRNMLVDRMQPTGIPAHPQYRLDIKNLREHIRSLDVTVRSDTTREQMKITADLALVEIATNKIVFERDLSARGSYNILESEYTSRVSRQDLRQDLLEKMALQAERYIGLYMQD